MSQIILTGIGDPAQNYRTEKDLKLTVGPADVLVRLEAAPVNPVDFLFANGWYAVQPQLPSTIGSEGVGRVVGAGRDADQDLVGKRIIVLPTYEQGLWADAAVVPARNVVAVPEGVDAVDARGQPVHGTRDSHQVRRPQARRLDRPEPRQLGRRPERDRGTSSWSSANWSTPCPARYVCGSRPVACAGRTS